MRTRAFRRHQTSRHMWRRLKEDRNQHYNDLTCACWSDPKVMAKFKEQPKHCSCWTCRNNRTGMGNRWNGLTIQEQRWELRADVEERISRLDSADRATW